MEKYLEQLTEKLNISLSKHKERQGQIRATGANASLVSNLMVNYYDVATPLSQLANIKAPDATLLMITPFDKSVIMDILKVISNSDLGLSAAEDGGTIRIVVPPLTSEKRDFFVKQNKEITEEAKISIRNIRQEINKKINNDADLSENEQKLALEKVQKEIEKFNKEVEELSKVKEKELTTL